MAIFYDKQVRKNLLRPDEPGKWYIRPKSIGTITEKEVAQQMVDETTLNFKEAEMALAQLRKVLIRNLKDSKTVRLGDWATFYVTAKSNGKETKEDSNARSVKQVRVRVRFEKAFMEEMQKSSFMYVNSIVRKEEAVEEPSEEETNG